MNNANQPLPRDCLYGGSSGRDVGLEGAPGLRMRLQNHTEQAQSAQYSKVKGNSAAMDKKIRLHDIKMLRRNFQNRTAKLGNEHLNTSWLPVVQLGKVTASLLELIGLVTNRCFEDVGEE
jgi:hypothetical protein